MKKRWWLRRVWFRAMFRLGHGRDIHGVGVFAIPPSDELVEKVGVALDVVAQYAPQSLERLRRYGSIMVHGKGAIGAWYRGAAVVKMAKHHVASTSSHPTLLAAAIVREATRARLEYFRLDWAPEGPQRIEAICLRTEKRFAARLLEHLRPPREVEQQGRAQGAEGESRRLTNGLPPARPSAAPEKPA